MLSSSRSSHQTLLKALLVFVMQSLVLVVLSPLIHCSVLLPSFFCLFFSFFSSLFPSILGIFWRGDSLACRNQASSTTPIFLSFTLHPTPSFTWSLTGACYPSSFTYPLKPLTQASISIQPIPILHATHNHVLPYPCVQSFNHTTKPVSL